MQLARRAIHPLQHWYRTVVHELGHVADAHGASPHEMVAAASGDGNCMLCPLFAQATTAAFSHALQIPCPLRTGTVRVAEPVAVAVEGSVPTPRSRGPPSLS
jgi:hypothetical protein